MSSSPAGWLLSVVRRLRALWNGLGRAFFLRLVKRGATARTIMGCAIIRPTHLESGWRLPRVRKLLGMQTPQPNQVTRLLLDWGRGDKAALDELMPIVYQELRQLASGYLRSEKRGHTLQPTALIHEAYLRLVDQNTPEWESRTHFFAVAARLMRQILVDHARTRVAAKRGGGQQKISLDDAPTISTRDDAAELLALDEALKKLASFDERKCRVIEMRSFGGMSVEETARALGVSEPTVKRETRLAQSWLRRELELKQ
jgi:RNA polymerase sigma-70 factor (ECF subfamily)